MSKNKIAALMIGAITVISMAAVPAATFAKESKHNERFDTVREVESVRDDSKINRDDKKSTETETEKPEVETPDVTPTVAPAPPTV